MEAKKAIVPQLVAERRNQGAQENDHGTGSMYAGLSGEGDASLVGAAEKLPGAITQGTNIALPLDGGLAGSVVFAAGGKKEKREKDTSKQKEEGERPSGKKISLSGTGAGRGGRRGGRKGNAEAEPPLPDPEQFRASFARFTDHFIVQSEQSAQGSPLSVFPRSDFALNMLQEIQQQNPETVVAQPHATAPLGAFRITASDPDFRDRFLAKRPIVPAESSTGWPSLAAMEEAVSEKREMRLENIASSVHLAADRGDMETARNGVLAWENERGYAFTGSGATPKVMLDGQTWADYYEERIRENPDVFILDIGAGDLAPAWTAPLDDIRLDENVRRVRMRHPSVSVVAQSALAMPSDYFRGTPVKDYRGGHFMDVLSQLKNEGKRFDIITSNFALYHSAFALETLPLIDDLLTPGGAAFLGEVSTGIKGNKAIIYPRGEIPVGHLSNQRIKESIGFKEAQVGGLPWQYRQNMEVAWKKGQFDRSRMPVFAGVRQLGPEYQLPDFHFLYTLPAGR